MKNLSNKSFMFKNCNSLVELSIENYNKYLSNISFDDVIGNIGDEIYYENKESENLLNNMIDSNSNENLLYRNCNDLSLSNYSEVLNKKSTDDDKKILIDYQKIIIKNSKENFIILNGLFENCTSLTLITNISIWDFNNILDMRLMFKNCKSLFSLPSDISKWNTENVTDMSELFFNCKSLSSLPDISKWDTKNVSDMNLMFSKCSSLLSFPDISKWKTNNLIYMQGIFEKCSSIVALPDISTWNTKKVSNMIRFFIDALHY